MVGRVCRATLAASLVFAGTGPTVRAQDTRVASSSTEVANRRVTVHADNAPLRTILENVAAQAGLTLVYQGSVVPPAARATVHLDSVSVTTAFASALRGTGAVAVLSAGSRAVIAPVAAQHVGIIQGKVLNAVSKEPVAQASIVVQGPLPAKTNAGSVQSAADGSFVVSNLKAGTYLVVVRKLAMRSEEKQVAVTTQIVRTEVGLSPAATMLETVVATGSGERERREVGNWVTSINADSIMKSAPIRNISDLLDGRAPGMNVQAMSGAAGAGSRIRIRGLSTMLASEDPIVIVDGVRVDGSFSSSGFGPSMPVGSSSTGVPAPGGNQAASGYKNVPVTSRLNDIDPASIESIDVLRGPAASTLYGSDAANGVIVIRTKRGKPGRTRWNFSMERGMSSIDTRYPNAFNGWGQAYGGVPYSNCTLIRVAAKLCTQDSLSQFNPLNDSETSPFASGRSERYNLQVSGGSDRLQYFLGGSYASELGNLHFPNGLVATTQQQLNDTPLPSWAKRPNGLDQYNVSATLTSQIGTSFDMTLATHVTHSMQTNSPDGYGGIVGSSVTSLGYRDTVTNGWGNSSPVENLLTRYSDEVNRLNTSLSARWQPTSYLSGNATVGIDYTARNDEALLRPDMTIQGITGTSKRNRDQRSVTMKNANLNATLQIPLRENMRLRTTVGGQYTGSSLSSMTTNAQGLSSGSGSVNGASYLFTYEFDSEWATAGMYIEGTLDINQRLFLTTALRRDASSAFGAGSTPVSYPKFSASWLVSEEPLFPRLPGVESFRLRTAFGQAGTQPNAAARFLTYSAPVQTISTLPAYIVNSVGNPDLLPERSQELEGGFDLSLINDRVTLEATFYRKNTHDALVTTPLPASVGIGTQVQNVGEVTNRGAELSSTLRLVTLRAFDWSTSFGYSRNTNKLVKLGTATQTNGEFNRYVEGYPIDGVWARAIVGYNDTNGNGILEPSEIRLTDSAMYAGSGVPRTTLNWHNTVSLLSGWITVNTGVSYRGRVSQVNGMLLRQCQAGRCRGAVDPTASMALQALAVTGSTSSLYTPWGFIETNSVVRFDEFSISANLPQMLLRNMRAQSASISLMGRNLGVWTKYRGGDPTVNGPAQTATTKGDLFGDFGGIPQPRTWSLRLNLAY